MIINSRFKGLTPKLGCMGHQRPNFAPSRELPRKSRNHLRYGHGHTQLQLVQKNYLPFQNIKVSLDFYCEETLSSARIQRYPQHLLIKTLHYPKYFRNLNVQKGCVALSIRAQELSCTQYSHLSEDNVFSHSSSFPDLGHLFIDFDAIFPFILSSGKMGGVPCK